MWEGALVVLGFTRMAMVWQPMPARARLPSGTRVERLCGQPEQKPGLRAGRPGVGPWPVALPCGATSVQPGATCGITPAITCATSCGEISAAFGKAIGPRAGSNSVPLWRLPTISGASALPYSAVRSCSSISGRFSSTTMMAFKPWANSRTITGSSGHTMPSLSRRMPAVSVSRSPMLDRACCTSCQLLPAEMMPTCAPGASDNISFRRLARA